MSPAPTRASEEADDNKQHEVQGDCTKMGKEGKKDGFAGMEMACKTVKLIKEGKRRQTSCALGRRGRPSPIEAYRSSVKALSQQPTLGSCFLSPIRSPRKELKVPGHATSLQSAAGAPCGCRQTPQEDVFSQHTSALMVLFQSTAIKYVLPQHCFIHRANLLWKELQEHPNADCDQNEPFTAG
ncbi:hypothetical protein Anapl_07405 [Anas platyrhynchos]|uniref:Uncharacterized protein n=1 Tax=Anas platyrhynchos TaxID=8839 RepID=R0M890_ANAPL|nr:hypothetical protein Anapl_07405 [Anas platyrhynchos]